MVLSYRSLQSGDAGLAVAGAAACYAAIIPHAMAVAGPTLCPFRLLTGIECPACGSTRAWSAALHGDVLGALTTNAFAVGLLLLCAVLIGWRLLSIVLPRVHAPDPSRIITSRIFKLVLTAWVAVWAVGIVV